MEHKEAKKNQSENKKKKGPPKNNNSVRSIWDNFKQSNICIIGVPEEEKEQEIGNLFEKIMHEKLPKMMKKTNMQVQEAQRVPYKMDSKRSTPRHIIIKMPKVRCKEKILKAATEKQLVTYRGVPIRLSADFSKETLQARRDQQEIFKVLESRDIQLSCSTHQRYHLESEGR